MNDRLHDQLDIVEDEIRDAVAMLPSDGDRRLRPFRAKLNTRQHQIAHQMIGLVEEWRSASDQLYGLPSRERQS